MSEENDKKKEDESTTVAKQAKRFGLLILEGMALAIGGVVGTRIATGTVNRIVSDK